VTLDPISGVVTALGTGITTSLPSASGVVALDSAGGRFFFVASPPSEADSRLYTFDTTTGTVLLSPVLVGSGTAPINALEYDAAAGVLYGLRNPGGGGRQLVTLDPVSGAMTALGTGISTPLPGASGVAALDSAGQRFFFVATPEGESDSRLYSFSTSTGATLSSPVITGSATAFINALAYDETAGQLFALRNPGGGGRQLVTLDPATATVTPVGTGITTSLPSASGVSALDSAGQQLFFVASPPGESDSRLYTFSTTTGATLHSPALVGSGAISGLAYAAPLVVAATTSDDPLTLAPDAAMTVRVSDIHFNPFFDDTLVPQLMRSPAEQWPELFATSSVTGHGTYFKTETNYKLLDSALAAAAAATRGPDFVLFTGDFLAHNFHEKYQAANQGSLDGLDDFITRTIAFVVVMFNKHFPGS
jgi:hypothetical protein